MVRVAVLIFAILVASVTPVLAQGFSIEMIVEPEAPYVQQQTQLTVRFYRESPIMTGNFVAPEFEGAAVEELGEVRPVYVMQNGVEMEMLEKRYLLFPQASGAFQIPGVVFSGREVFAKANPISLTVRAVPEGVGGHWMPALSLKASENWIMPPGEIQAGMSIERQVTYEAVGLTAAQLPTQEAWEVDGISIERLPPILEDQIEGGTVKSKRVERMVLTPHVGGTLGAVSETVTWWDVAAGQPRYIHLPGRAFRIKGLAQPRLDEDANVETPKTEQRTEVLKSPTATHKGWWIASGAGLVLLAIGLFGILPRWAEAQKPLKERRKALADWERAVSAGDFISARKALLHWGRIAWPSSMPVGLREIASRLSSKEFSNYVEALEIHLYGGKDADILAHQDAVRALLRSASETKRLPRRRDLPSLNPQ